MTHIEVSDPKILGRCPSRCCPLQEIDCAYDILLQEGANFKKGDLGELVPVAMIPQSSGGLPLLGEERRKSRKVFLTCSQGEDLFWAVDTINFVIDVGVEKRDVSIPRIPGICRTRH